MQWKGSFNNDSRKNITTQLKLLNGKCIYTHCYGHALNLAVQDPVKFVKCLNEAFRTAFETCKLVEKAPWLNTKLDTPRESSSKKMYMHFAQEDG